MIPRKINVPEDHSFFLFGPRGSGKSTLLRNHFSDRLQTIWIDLLDPEEEALFQTNPHELIRRTDHLSPNSWIIIDEVQRVPNLLNLVHKLIEEKRLLFALSGSSARKLMRGHANLLAGRAFMCFLYPFSFQELQPNFNLEHTLSWGLLPSIHTFNDDSSKKRYLRAYANTYLKEEIQAEQIVRNLPVFRKFLEIAAQMNGKPINYSKIARDIHTDHSVVRNYFSILEDTLIGFHLPAYDISIRKQIRKAPKFYFMDTGIKCSLEKTLDIPMIPKTYSYGRAFEHFFILELFKQCQYREKDESLYYLQTKDDTEIDLIIERPGKCTLCIEIKSSDHIDSVDIRSFKKITADFNNSKSFIISRDLHTKTFSHITAYHWSDFLDLFQKEAI